VITDVAGLRVGHWTDPVAETGCTVVLFPEGTVASGEVRGGAPATREFALLDPQRMVTRLDALVLTGGSAFGLAAADGVVRHCEERGAGFVTPEGPVPIVVALALYDLGTGDATVRPGADQGYAACVAATDGPVETGRVGAGTGARVSGPDFPTRAPGGLVSAGARAGDLVVAALVAVNAAGQPGGDDALALRLADLPTPGLENTVIGVVATNARLDKLGCHLVAQGAHDGLARAVFPAHTRSDGDAFVAAATGEVEARVDVVRALSVHVVAQAILTLVAG
jgi:L-aminopeptidase/D-esterase-like protein